MDAQDLEQRHFRGPRARVRPRRAQNRARKAVVPDRAIDAMLEHWEVPDRTEAHEVTYVVR